jgi:hypothetical protein
MANICITIAGENLDDVLNDLADLGLAAIEGLSAKYDFEDPDEFEVAEPQGVDSETCADCGGSLDEEPDWEDGYYLGTFAQDEAVFKGIVARRLDGYFYLPGLAEPVDALVIDEKVY